jgi:hypothetical protein
LEPLRDIFGRIAVRSAFPLLRDQRAWLENASPAGLAFSLVSLNRLEAALQHCSAAGHQVAAALGRRKCGTAKSPPDEGTREYCEVAPLPLLGSMKRPDDEIAIIRLLEHEMRKQNHDDLAGRQRSAADAKAALLQSHRAAKEAAEPTRLVRQEERLSVAAAKDRKQAERARLKAEEQERLKAEAEAAADERGIVASATGFVEATEKLQYNRTTSEAEDAAVQKAVRDRRYANRKARQR